MIRIEHNVATGEIVEIELSAKEIADIEKLQKANAAALATAEAKEAAKAAAKAAILDKLGLSAEEVTALLG